MIHILVGAGIGALVGLASYVVVGKLTHQRLSWHAAIAAVLAGAVGGGVTAATLGAGGVAAATFGRTLGAASLGGFAGGATNRTTDDVLTHRTPGKDVLQSAAVGAATGVAFGVAERIVGQFIEGAATTLRVPGDPVKQAFDDMVAPVAKAVRSGTSALPEVVRDVGKGVGKSATRTLTFNEVVKQAHLTASPSLGIAGSISNLGDHSEPEDAPATGARSKLGNDGVPGS